MEQPTINTNQQYSMKRLTFTKETIEAIRLFAEIYAKSSAYNKTDGTVNDIVLRIIFGMEIGLPMATAVQSVSIINNRICVDGKGMLSVILASGLLKSMKIEASDQKAVVEMVRNGNISHTEVFTIEDARKAGLLKPNGSWDKYPKTMLKWRAVAACARVLFPDVISGVYTPEEMLDGNVEVSEDGTMTPLVQPVVIPPSINAMKQAMFDRLIEAGYYPDADSIRAVVNNWRETSGGAWKHPSTQEEFDVLETQLIEYAQSSK